MPKSEFELIQWSEKIKNCHKEKEEWVCQLCDEKRTGLHCSECDISKEESLSFQVKSASTKSTTSEVSKLSMLDFGSDSDDE